MMWGWDAAAIRRAEAPLLEAGVPLMQEAAHAIAVRCCHEISARGHILPGSVALALVGGGNNGGDALYAAATIARRGLLVYAALLTEDAHAEGLAAATKAGVRIHHLRHGESIDESTLLDLARRSGLWIDGIAGIGLSGPLRPPVAGAVEALIGEKVSSPDEPIVVAVDVPSGVGDAGVVSGSVLPADVTVTMGGAKVGLLTPAAARVAGRIQVVGLGIPVYEQDPSAFRMSGADVSDIYPWPEADDHKYTRGVVGVWSGSEEYPGAGTLAVLGALGVGPGMVRAFGNGHFPPEAVRADGQIQAGVVGPGMPDDRAAEALGQAVARGVPLVVDAGALGVMESFEETWSAPVLATPHAGELARMLGIERQDVEDAPIETARQLANRSGAVVVVKGPTTAVVPPEGPWASQRVDVPWLASAGTGDVLAGALGGLLAMDVARRGKYPSCGRLAKLAAAGVWLHGQAARWASGGGPLRASVVAAMLPRVIAALR